MASTRALASAVSGAYSWVEQQGQRDDRAGLESPCSARYPPRP